ncbi:sensor histidine kinase NtrY-like [Roseospira visakhapatnamensis]|uniref:Nitrogen regulation protein n=1 Tax=Roseospira visakhapatnamensis TaxID=390880 RepID=A0A7W6W8Y5_9PROT|nr:PAS domain-containing sensor histidine kinase [Roseospira visakhapatnamensis]MBB4265339.1 two-component system nitrogen regulation sensor histidine kinase NtrY [Roseospira visakhapatnamensis]
MSGSSSLTFNRRLMRFGLWARRIRLTRALTWVLAVAAVLSVGATVVALGGFGPTVTDPSVMLVLLNVNLVIMLALGVLVARRLVKVWAARRSGGAGSRLHVRLVVLFGVLAVTPAILTSVFSVLMFQVGVQGWFSSRVSTAVNESQRVAQAYLREHQQAIAGEVLAMANDLNRDWLRVSRNPSFLNNFLATQASLRNLTEAVIFAKDGKVIARAGYIYSLQFEEVPFWAMDRADGGEVALLTGENEDRVRGLVRLESLSPLYLFVGRFVDPEVLGAIESTEQAAVEYRALEGRRSSYEFTLSMIFVMASLLLLLAAIAVGLTMATRLAQPIMALIDAADRVRQGNLRVRVKEIAANDEVASLSRAFNRMTEQLDAQHKSLTHANQELDERRRFTETVLAGVSAGVIALDRDGRVTLFNRSASELLGENLDGWVGQPADGLFGQIGDLMAQIRARPDRPAQAEVSYVQGGHTLTLLARLGAERDEDGGILGFVLTFDDITELQQAQRMAAWADVARRIAHEIKNPLTPIQLSAERLKRRYLRQLSQDQDTFVQCTDTIVRHVSDIGQMVDEFSAFARMPAPTMRLEVVGSIVRQAVVLQRTAYPRIAFRVAIPEAPVRLRCDTRQVTQALTNLLKNAVEGIDARREKEKDQAPAGEIVVSLAERDTSVVIVVEDNGKGLPPTDRDRLTEPYVTTRSKGTGLGLAIVKKILEDHGGALVLGDGVQGGARVSLVFPRPAEAAVDPESDGTVAAAGAPKDGPGDPQAAAPALDGRAPADRQDALIETKGATTIDATRSGG